ncbi:MAG: hypothetical protein WCO10_01780 [bacterium]
MKKTFFFSFLFTLLIIGVLPALSSAQTTNTATPNLNDQFLQISLSPDNPEPGQNYSATISSYVFDLDRSTIRWYVNGQLKKEGSGLKVFYDQAGKSGVATVIRAVATTQDNQTSEISATIVPASVDLIYEAYSYVPPFYKGKALNVNQGSVILAAIPNIMQNGTKIAAQKLVYTWKKDGTVQGSFSGVGKNTFSFNGSVPIRDVEIEVSVSSPDNSVTASKSLTVPFVSPKILFYEDSPVYGTMFNRAITQTVGLLTDEFSVKAFPYFFSAGFPQSSNLIYNWTMNGQGIETPAVPNLVTFRQDTPGAGNANVGLKISNTARIFQFVENNFSILFQKQ